MDKRDTHVLRHTVRYIVRRSDWPDGPNRRWKDWLGTSWLDDQMAGYLRPSQDADDQAVADEFGHLLDFGSPRFLVPLLVRAYPILLVHDEGGACRAWLFGEPSLPQHIELPQLLAILS